MPSAQEALAHVNAQNKRQRQQWDIRLEESLPPLYIFNIYQKQWDVPLGGLGTFHIPACQEGKPCSEPLKVKGMNRDEYDLGDGNGHMSWNVITGEDLAKSIVGLDSGSPALGTFTTNREWWGVFISRNDVPSEAELAEAQKKLTALMTLYLEQGDALAAQGKPGDIGPNERKAAQFLNQKRAWAQLPEKMDSCPGCGEPIKPGVIKCKECGAILDMEKAASLGMLTENQLAAMLSAREPKETRKRAQ